MRGTFATRIDTIVTANTVIDKRRVIHHGRNPGTGRMTGIAFLRGYNMRGSFTCRHDVVMAGGTHANHFIMIHRTVGNGRPWGGTGLMTGFAGIGGINVRRALATRNGAIVATHTGANDLHVIHVGGDYGRPGCWSGCVACVTLITAVDMIDALA